MVVVALAWLTLPFASRARLIFDISHFHALLLSLLLALASSTSVFAFFRSFSNSPPPPFSVWSRAREPIAPQMRGSTVTAIIGHSSSSRVHIYIYIYIYLFNIFIYIYIYLFISHNRYFFTRSTSFFLLIYLEKYVECAVATPRGGRTSLERVRKNER